ncbi:hypothetical protein [Candidatus Neptunochlamydia vexilliferae]|uniref:Fungal lipase-like domain-containing protein n=1 Tax=Candidatus Neptunichlamydia vexilliferae TaxID=1651774 RepID=A0ABS0AY57_9BACT|nr:hypothetical protein [Candidatus Neptunochlamydia vexilliferae]MBF5059071.1 hypothetical protein [Candidatus Neptunochlamydia vexilliferae]
MSALETVTNRKYTEYTHVINNGNGNQPGESIIFVNGIMNELQGLKIDKGHLKEAGAKTTANEISSKINNKRVVLFYNPTLCLSNRDITAGKNEVAKLYPLLAELIESEHERCSPDTSKRVLVIAHSHGALLTCEALKLVTQQKIQDIEVATFGGARLVPNSLGKKVQNFIHESDLISILAQVKFKTGYILTDFFTQKREEFLGIESNLVQTQKIKNAFSAHLKFKDGQSLDNAKKETYAEELKEILNASLNKSKKEKINLIIEAMVKIIVVELSFSLEILSNVVPHNNSALLNIPHDFCSTYLDKAVEIVNART